nr:MAG TPA: sheath tube [Caudoviricetes sp.]
MADGFLHGVEVLEIDTGARPIETVRSSVIGIVGTAPRADEAAFPLNTPVMIAGSRAEAAKLRKNTGSADGTLPDALDSIFDQAGAVVVVVRVEAVDDAQQQLANVVGGVDSNTGAYTGVHALLGAESKLGVAPRILIAPGFTHQRSDDTKNAVVAELQGIAERMRAVVIADGPNTNDEAAQKHAQQIGSPRVYVVDPWVRKLNETGQIVDAPPSACVAGIIAKTDNDSGFWVSPSNKPINGIVGVSRPVDFVLGDTSSRANLLNENHVATIIRQDGYRLWGNRTSAKNDPKWMYLSVRRTADMINDSLLRAHMWAVDRNITKTYLQDVTEGVNAYLRHLANIGAIINGRCWADPELNTPDQIQQGRVYVDFDFSASYPAEHITFRSQLTNRYLTEVF